MNVFELAGAIKSLDDSSLQELVSHLNSDYIFEQKSGKITPSSMEAMIYAYNTSRKTIADRKVSLREQASIKY